MSDRKCSNLKRFDPITILQTVQILLGGISKDDESERCNNEWNALCQWAQSNGVLYLGDIRQLLLSLEHASSISSIKDDAPQWDKTGHEHDVLLIPPYYYKKTKWNCSGYTFDSETKAVTLATVREYLIRLILHNSFFNTGIEILGVVAEGNNRSILIRQRIIDGDVPSSIEEMDELFCRQFSCKKIKDESHYQGYKGNIYKVAVFYIADMRPDNCKIITRKDGKRHIIPFDCFVSFDQVELRENFKKLKNQMGIQ